MEDTFPAPKRKGMELPVAPNIYQQNQTANVVDPPLVLRNLKNIYTAPAEKWEAKVRSKQDAYDESKEAFEQAKEKLKNASKSEKAELRAAKNAAKKAFDPIKEDYNIANDNAKFYRAYSDKLNELLISFDNVLPCELEYFNTLNVGGEDIPIYIVFATNDYLDNKSLGMTMYEPMSMPEGMPSKEPGFVGDVGIVERFVPYAGPEQSPSEVVDDKFPGKPKGKNPGVYIYLNKDPGVKTLANELGDVLYAVQAGRYVQKADPNQSEGDKYRAEFATKYSQAYQDYYSGVAAGKLKQGKDFPSLNNVLKSNKKAIKKQFEPRD